MWGTCLGSTRVKLDLDTTNSTDILVGPFFTACLTILDHLPRCPLTPLWYQHCLTHPICKGWQPTKMKKPQHCSGIFYRALTIHCDQSSQQRPIFQDKLGYSIWEFQMFLAVRLLQSKIQAKTNPCHAILLLPLYKSLDGNTSVSRSTQFACVQISKPHPSEMWLIKIVKTVAPSSPHTTTRKLLRLIM